MIANIDFSHQEKNLVYLDKVYSYNQAYSCPLLSAFMSSPGNSVTELKLEGAVHRDRCGCGGRGCLSCCPNILSLDPDAVFTIDSSYVLVDSFSLAHPSSLKPECVTLDGYSADGIYYGNGRYSVAINNLLPKVIKKRCRDLGVPTKAYFLVMESGPWAYKATFVLEGTVNTHGRTAVFKAKIKTSDDVFREVKGASSFAVAGINIPCSVNGTCPVINFSFTGSVSMLNPKLAYVCTGSGCGLHLETNLVCEPIINVEVLRKTLCCADACESMLPCDGTEYQYGTIITEECDYPHGNTFQINGCNGCTW
jgi:hypothetical protein